MIDHCSVADPEGRDKRTISPPGGGGGSWGSGGRTQQLILHGSWPPSTNFLDPIMIVGCVITTVSIMTMYI